MIKVNSKHLQKDAKGQSHLAAGKSVSMRMWQEGARPKTEARRRDYETVGYVISGHAELYIEGETVKLEPGDSWVVPMEAEHSYRILDDFLAVEATAPPAEVEG